MATVEEMASEKGRGRGATTPSQLPLAGWKDILRRVWLQVSADRVTLIAAGATFYLLLALFPALAAFVSIYGFVADPITIADHIAFLGGILPRDGVELIRSQLENLAGQDEAALSFGFVLGLGVALWSANNGIKSLFEAMNVAYGEAEKRSFLKLNAISFLFTLGAIVIGILFIVSVGIIPAALALLGLGGIAELLISLLRWPVLAIAAALAISVLYRYGPSRETARWRWVTWGSALATVVWLGTSVAFSWYLQNFADYNATYGSLGAVIGVMMWTWLSVVILIVGAELNSEMEHQTARDSTTGPELPLGARGATMADTIGASSEDAGARRAAVRARREPMRFAGQQGETSPQPLRRSRPLARGERSGAVLAFALPLVAVAFGLLLGQGDRRQAARMSGATAEPAAGSRFGVRQMRELLDRPDMRDRLAHAGRTALLFARRTAQMQASGRSVRRRWPWS